MMTICLVNRTSATNVEFGECVLAEQRCGQQLDRLWCVFRVKLRISHRQIRGVLRLAKPAKAVLEPAEQSGTLDNKVRWR
jgi:hypothetical protein